MASYTFIWTPALFSDQLVLKTGASFGELDRAIVIGKSCFLDLVQIPK